MCLNGQEPLWTVHDLARNLVVPVNTIYKWRTAGYGPRALKIGKYVRYREADVRAWLATLDRR